MPAKYKLVLRKDMRKDAAEGSKLYYASANTTGTCDVYELCDLISAQSTASSGDVKLILDELVNVMRRNLGKGEVVKVGELGSFQLQFGSTGTLTEKEFSHALIKSRRIVFRPGSHEHGLADWRTFLDFMQWRLCGKPRAGCYDHAPFA